MDYNLSFTNYNILYFSNYTVFYAFPKEFIYHSRASLVADHFLYSRDLNVRGDIVRRNWMLVTLWGPRTGASSWHGWGPRVPVTPPPPFGKPFFNRTTYNIWAGKTGEYPLFDTV